MTNPLPKTVMVPITDAAEIASIERNTFPDILGGKVGETYWADKISLLDWRERQAQSNTDSGVTK